MVALESLLCGLAKDQYTMTTPRHKGVGNGIAYIHATPESYDAVRELLMSNEMTLCVRELKTGEMNLKGMLNTSKKCNYFIEDWCLAVKTLVTAMWACKNPVPPAELMQTTKVPFRNRMV